MSRIVVQAFVTLDGVVQGGGGLEELLVAVTRSPSRSTRRSSEA